MRAVLITIADAANADGQHAHPGMRAIVSGSLYSERTAQSTITRLVTDGWLEVEEEGGGRGKATVYRVLMETPQSSRGIAETPQKPRNLETETPQSELIAQCFTTNSTTTRTEVDPLRGFDHFWRVYPRRNGRIIGRALCEKRWVKLTLDERRAAYRGAQAYRADVDAGKTIAKDPDRWLRDRIWTDWLDDPEQPEAGVTLGPNEWRPPE
jgi:hypothetical protein